jgi:hypothetical protein
METFYYIYKITNNINNKKYIGRRKFIGNDIKSDKYIGSGKLLSFAIKKYGIENFSKEILHICKNKNEMYLMEEYYIDKYDAVFSKEFYNLCPGGKLSGGYLIENFPDEEKQKIYKKISNTLKGRKRGKNKNQSLRMKNYWAEMEKKKKNRKIEELHSYNKGRKMTDKQRKKISISNKGKHKGEKNGFYGKHHSIEQKEKWSLERKSRIPWNKGLHGVQKCSNKTKEVMRQNGLKKKNTIWINNGSINKRILPEDFVQNQNYHGWKKGMIHTHTTML